LPLATWNVQRIRQSDCLTRILSHGHDYGYFYGYGYGYGYGYNDGFHIPALHLTKLTGCQSTAISVAVAILIVVVVRIGSIPA